MLPWNYASNANRVRRNNGTRQKQNTRTGHNTRQRNAPRNSNTNQKNSSNQSENVPQNDISKQRAEEIKRAIKENRIEFVDGGARILGGKGEGVSTAITNPEKPTAVEEVKEVEENNSHFEKLTDFIQNERNASIFYKYLASIANKEENANILNSLSEESLKRLNSLSFVYEDKFGDKYDAKNSKINNTVKFKEGIAWAISVENKNLIEMIDMYENLTTEKYLRKINSIIYRKTCSISFLHLILSNTKGIFS